MSETSCTRQSVWAHLQEEFPAGATAATVAESMGAAANAVTTILSQLAKRNAVTLTGRDDESGAKIYQANPNASFNRRRGATDAGAGGPSPRRRRTKAHDRGQVHSASRESRIAVTAGRDPHHRPDLNTPTFAINDRYQVAVTVGPSAVVLDKAAALKLLEFLGSMEPLLAA